VTLECQVGLHMLTIVRIPSLSAVAAVHRTVGRGGCNIGSAFLTVSGLVWLSPPCLLAPRWFLVFRGRQCASVSVLFYAERKKFSQQIFTDVLLTQTKLHRHYSCKGGWAQGGQPSFEMDLLPPWTESVPLRWEEEGHGYRWQTGNLALTHTKGLPFLRLENYSPIFF
jgi:hypothetical protein